MPDIFQRVPVKNIVRGLRRNVAQNQLDAGQWWTLDNFQIRNGAIQKVPGYTELSTQAEGVVSLIGAAKYGGASYQRIIGTSEYLYQYSDVLSQLNDVAFQSPSWIRWQACVWLYKLYLANRLNHVQRWDGRSSRCDTLAATSPQGRSIEQFQNHLILGNVRDNDGDAPDGLAGSGLPDTGGDADWNYTDEASDAFSQQITTEGDSIQRIVRLGNYLAIYKEFSTHLLSYVGQPYVYSIQQVPARIGMVSPWALEQLSGNHVFVGQEDLYQFSGTMPQGFGVRVWSYLVELALAAGLKNIWTFHAVQNKEIVFALPTGKAVVWNYEYDAFTTRDWPFTAAGYLPALELTIGEHREPIIEWVTPITPETAFTEFSPYVGDSNGKLYQLDTGTPAGTATAETGEMDFGKPDTMKLCDGIDLDVPTLTGTPLSVYIGTRNNDGEAVTWSSAYSYSSGSTVFCMAYGKLFRFKFVKTDGTFTMRGFSPSIRMTSRW